MGNNTSSQIRKDKLEELNRDTKFTQKEIKAIFKQFKKESPTGVISQEEFREALNQMGVVDELLQDVIFRVFVDTKDAKSINFGGFVNVLSIMNRGTPDEKLKFAFDMYDMDGSGSLTKDKLLQILESYYKLVGPMEDSPLTSFSGQKYDSPQQLVDEIFEQMDTDKDGKISFKDYQEGASKNPDIVQGLKLFTDTKR